QGVSPVGSGGSGNSSGSGHCGGSGSGGNGSSSHRRSSLADIPKALFSSLRRGPHSSSSETNSNKEPVNNAVPKYAQQQYQQQQQQQQRREDREDSPASSYEGDDDDSTAPDGGEDDQDYGGRQGQQQQQQQPVSATILTANGLMQATMAVPKAPPPYHTVMVTRHLPPTTAKGILKKRSPPSPLSQQLLPYKMTPIINRNNSSNSNLVHPMAGNDRQVRGLLRATEHRARLETSSPIPSHPQLMKSRQQKQSQLSMRRTSASTPVLGGIQRLQYTTTPAHYTGYGSYGEKNVVNTTTTTTPATGMLPKFGSTVELDDRYLTHSGGAAFPPNFTPGMQSNVYQDRGGEHSQGKVLDSRMMEMDPSFSLQGATLPSPPVAVAAAAASAAHGFQYQLSHSQANDQHHYSGTGGTYAGHDQNSSMMDGPHQPMAMTEMHEITIGYGYSNEEYSHGSSMRSDSGINESTMGILSGNGISHHRTRTIGFVDTIEIIPAHRKSEYNRRSDKYATFKILTPDLKSEIRDELNVYKMREMAVHVESMGNTAFH
ncbi:hypothetical protein BGZ96_001257, partial [Linnemannia gamsii]